MHGRWRGLAKVGALAVAASLPSCGRGSDISARLTAPQVPSLSAAQAAETETTSERVPFEAMMLNCDGVPLLVTGDLHLVDHLTINGTGSHFVQNLNRVDVVGEAGGVTYRATGGIVAKWNFNGPPPISTSYIQNFRVISQGPGDNFQFHSTLHVTINANRVVTSNVDNTKVDCEG